MKSKLVINEFIKSESMKRTRPSVVALVVFALLTSGCAVGPDYEQPSLSVADAYHSAPLTPGDQPRTLSTHHRFWQGFGDPLLAELIKETLSANLDLQAAVARYQSSAALLRLSRREHWPSITAFAEASDQKLAVAERRTNGDARFDLYDAGVALHWEMDLFGRLGRISEAAKADLEATGADVQALQVALVGQLATNYWQLRGLQQQYAVIEQNIALQQSSLEIVNARLDAGRGTTLDALRAQAQLDATRAALPDIQTAMRGAMHRIAVLSGKSPEALIARLSTVSPLPKVTPNIAVATPGDVLRRRPDIRAAERRVAAASARIGVASADLFPRFTLQGLVGSLALESGDWFAGSTDYRRITLGIDWTFLDRAQVSARIDAADAEAVARLAEYRQAVLLALEETETWLVRLQQSQARVAFLQNSTTAFTRAVDQARARYEQGYIDYFELLSVELELTHARDSLVRGHTEQALAMVNVYRSLAGAPDLAAEQNLSADKPRSVAGVTW